MILILLAASFTWQQTVPPERTKAAVRTKRTAAIPAHQMGGRVYNPPVCEEEPGTPAPAMGRREEKRTPALTGALENADRTGYIIRSCAVFPVTADGCRLCHRHPAFPAATDWPALPPRGLFQQQHAEPGLADSSADGIGKLRVEHRLVKGQCLSVQTVFRFQLPVKTFFIHPDAHGADLQSLLQRFIPEQDIPVEIPVVIVRCPSVMLLSIPHHGTNLHDKDTAQFPGDGVFRSFGVSSGYRSRSCSLVTK